jgi:chromosome segregation ATPase
MIVRLQINRQTSEDEKLESIVLAPGEMFITSDKKLYVNELLEDSMELLKCTRFICSEEVANMVESLQTTLETNISENKSSIETLTKSVDANKSNVEKKITELSNAISSEGDALVELSGRVTAVEGDVASLKTTVPDIYTSKEEFNKHVETYKSHVTSNTNKFNSIDKSIESLQTADKEDKNTVAGLTTRVTNIEKEPNIYSGTSIPPKTTGSAGDVYVQYE